MRHQLPDIRAGLYLVATPIGTASDISLRALDLIASANVLVAEDKRQLLKLMGIHGIDLVGRPLISYHDHNGQGQRPKVLAMLKENKSVVLVSDAGTPLIADPGYRLLSDAIANGCYVTTVPGASSVLAALAISGLPTDKFFFGGFIPAKSEAKKLFFSKYLNLPGTLIFYESALRLNKTLFELCLVCDSERPVVVCRELTKKFEHVKRGSLQEVAAYFATIGKIKGEIALLIGSSPPKLLSEIQIDDILIDALDYMTLKDAVSFSSKRLNVAKKIVYERALKIKNKL